MNPIVHFDLPADDLQRAQQFYTELFGWEFKKAPGMEYYLVRTSHEPVELGGGMGLRQDEQQQIMHFISVEDIEHMKKRIQSSGGEAGDRITVPGWGYMCTCSDTEGNTFGLWQDDKDAA